jgi:glycerate kinase
MRKHLGSSIVLALLACGALAAQDVATAVEGTVKKVDKGTKTAVVKTADGTEHTIHFIGKPSRMARSAPPRERRMPLKA